MTTEAKSRNEVLELAGLVVSLVGGAAIGLFIPIKAEGGGATTVIAALVGGIVWSQRRQPFSSTIALCVITAAIGWPIAVVFLDWLHQYY